MQIRFGAQATPAQATAAADLARKLFDDETADNAMPGLTFFNNVRGLRDFPGTVDKTNRDGRTLNVTLMAYSATGDLPKTGNVDALYHWRFPNAFVARLGEQLVKAFASPSNKAGRGQTEVRRDGNDVLARIRAAASEFRQ